MSDDGTENSKKEKISLIIKKIQAFRKEPSGSSYIELLDIKYRKSCIEDLSEDNMMRHVALVERTPAEQLELAERGREILKEYLTMKSFILNEYVYQVARQAGLSDRDNQEKVRKNIETEMEETLKNLTSLTSRLSNQNGSALDKDLAYLDLKVLIQDLIFRVDAYRPYYQSHLTDSDMQSQVIYTQN